MLSKSIDILQQFGVKESHAPSALFAKMSCVKAGGKVFKSLSLAYRLVYLPACFSYIYK